MRRICVRVSGGILIRSVCMYNVHVWTMGRPSRFVGLTCLVCVVARPIGLLLLFCGSAPFGETL